MFRSFYESQQEILSAIRALHCPDGFECDATFGNGAFYRDGELPKYRYDISPQVDGVEEADYRLLPLAAGLVSSIILDPPFLTYVRNGREHKNGAVLMSKRFGGFYTYAELEDSYQEAISEAYRVLRFKGKMVFKCQDIIHNHQMHATHVKVIQMAELEGFRLVDLFVLAAKHRMPGPQKGTQRHARVWHSYFLVFEKTNALRSSRAAA